MSSMDISAMLDAVNNLKYSSVSSNADSSAPCTVEDLERLRDNLADTLTVIINLPFRKSVPAVYWNYFLCMFIRVARILSWILLSEKPVHD